MPPWHGSIAPDRHAVTPCATAARATAQLRASTPLAERARMKISSLSFLPVLLIALVPAAAVAGNKAAPPPAHMINATVDLRASDGKSTASLAVATIEHQCVNAAMRDDVRSLEVQLCHREETSAGSVLHVTWSLVENAGKRQQSHEAWAVVAAGGTLEVGAAKGKGESLLVTLK
jgi:hypothetical protein